MGRTAATRKVTSLKYGQPEALEGSDSTRKDFGPRHSSDIMNALDWSLRLARPSFAHCTLAELVCNEEPFPLFLSIVCAYFFRSDEALRRGASPVAGEVLVLALAVLCSPQRLTGWADREYATHCCHVTESNVCEESIVDACIECVFGCDGGRSCCLGCNGNGGGPSNAATNAYHCSHVLASGTSRSVCSTLPSTALQYHAYYSRVAFGIEQLLWFVALWLLDDIVMWHYIIITLFIPMTLALGGGFTWPKAILLMTLLFVMVFYHATSLYKFDLSMLVLAKQTTLTKKLFSCYGCSLAITLTLSFLGIFSETRAVPVKWVICLGRNLRRPLAPRNVLLHHVRCFVLGVYDSITSFVDFHFCAGLVMWYAIAMLGHAINISPIDVVSLITTPRLIFESVTSVDGYSGLKHCAVLALFYAASYVVVSALVPVHSMLVFTISMNGLSAVLFMMSSHRRSTQMVLPYFCMWLMLVCVELCSHSDHFFLYTERDAVGQPASSAACLNPLGTPAYHVEHYTIKAPFSSFVPLYLRINTGVICLMLLLYNAVHIIVYEDELHFCPVRMVRSSASTVAASTAAAATAATLSMSQGSSSAKANTNNDHRQKQVRSSVHSGARKRHESKGVASTDGSSNSTMLPRAVENTESAIFNASSSASVALPTFAHASMGAKAAGAEASSSDVSRDNGEASSSSSNVEMCYVHEVNRELQVGTAATTATEDCTLAFSSSASGDNEMCLAAEQKIASVSTTTASSGLSASTLGHIHEAAEQGSLLVQEAGAGDKAVVAVDEEEGARNVVVPALASVTEEEEVKARRQKVEAVARHHEKACKQVEQLEDRDRKQIVQTEDFRRERVQQLLSKEHTSLLEQERRQREREAKLRKQKEREEKACFEREEKARLQKEKLQRIKEEKVKVERENAQREKESKEREARASAERVRLIESAHSEARLLLIKQEQLKRQHWQRRLLKQRKLFLEKLLIVQRDDRARVLREQLARKNSAGAGAAAPARSIPLAIPRSAGGVGITTRAAAEAASSLSATKAPFTMKKINELADVVGADKQSDQKKLPAQIVICSDADDATILLSSAQHTSGDASRRTSLLSRDRKEADRTGGRREEVARDDESDGGDSLRAETEEDIMQRGIDVLKLLSELQDTDSGTDTPEELLTPRAYGIEPHGAGPLSGDLDHFSPVFSTNANTVAALMGTIKSPGGTLGAPGIPFSPPSAEPQESRRPNFSVTSGDSSGAAGTMRHQEEHPNTVSGESHYYVIASPQHNGGNQSHHPSLHHPQHHQQQGGIPFPSSPHELGASVSWQPGVTVAGGVGAVTTHSQFQQHLAMMQRSTPSAEPFQQSQQQFAQAGGLQNCTPISVYHGSPTMLATSAVTAQQQQLTSQQQFQAHLQQQQQLTPQQQVTLSPFSAGNVQRVFLAPARQQQDPQHASIVLVPMSPNLSQTQQQPPQQMPMFPMMYRTVYVQQPTTSQQAISIQVPQSQPNGPYGTPYSVDSSFQSS